MNIAEQQPNALAGFLPIEAQRAIAETQAAMMLARAMPRDEAQSLKRILEACSGAALALDAVYLYARQRTDISDASIRLAEVMAREWGNMQYGIAELSQENGASTMQAYAWDLERRVRSERRFIVKHIRSTRGGGYALEDPRDIYELTANMGARRLRACILAIIPTEIKEAAIAKADETCARLADLTPDGIDKMLTAFSRYNVGPELLTRYLQRPPHDMKARQYVALRKIHAALRDGIAAPADYFEGWTPPVRQAPKPEAQSTPDPEIDATATKRARDRAKRLRQGGDSTEAEKTPQTPDLEDENLTMAERFRRDSAGLSSDQDET